MYLSHTGSESLNLFFIPGLIPFSVAIKNFQILSTYILSLVFFPWNQEGVSLQSNKGQK